MRNDDDFSHVPVEHRIKCVLRVIEQETQIYIDVILSERRDMPVMIARHVAYMLVRVLCPTMTLSAIARRFRRDHSTIFSALQHFEHGEVRRRWLYDKCYPRVIEILRDHQKMPARIERPTVAPVASVNECEPSIKSASRHGYLDTKGAIICLP